MSLVMFDYDGVIADSLDAHVKSFLAAFRDNGCTNMNTAQDIIDLYEDNVYRSMSDLGLSEEEIDKILDSYNGNQARLLDQIQLFPQIKELFFRSCSSRPSGLYYNFQYGGGCIRSAEQKRNWRY